MSRIVSHRSPCRGGHYSACDCQARAREALGIEQDARLLPTEQDRVDAHWGEVFLTERHQQDRKRDEYARAVAAAMSIPASKPTPVVSAAPVPMPVAAATVKARPAVTLEQARLAAMPVKELLRLSLRHPDDDDVRAEAIRRGLPVMSR